MNTFFYKDIAYPDGVIGGKDYYNPVIYSTNERLIGVGENNKPLYQKTVISNTLNSEETETVLTGVDSLKVISLRTNNIYPFYVSLYNVSGSGTEYGGVFFENNNVILYNFSRAHAVVIEVVLQYTKVTDTAGSAPYNNNGVPTVRYSTDEQMIGLWADGKPLYRKTWTGLNSPTNGNEWATLQGVDASLWDEIIKMQLYTYVNNKLTNIALSEYRDFNGVAQISIVSSVFDRTVNVATIEYTKTTD